MFYSRSLRRPWQPAQLLLNAKKLPARELRRRFGSGLQHLVECPVHWQFIEFMWLKYTTRFICFFIWDVLNLENENISTDLPDDDDDNDNDE